LEPVNTSGPLYCLVWISVAKWWCYQQAFPKSAIFTLNPFYSLGPLSMTNLVSNALNSCLIFFYSRGFFTFLTTFFTGSSVFTWFSFY
jgi:hypothetical protein